MAGWTQNDEKRRRDMVDTQIAARGVTNRAVLDAMRKVPRHEFVPESWLEHAYADHPLPIGEGQTISQPYIVAAMTELLELDSSDTVLEVGTGSGYQTAVLCEIVEHVYSIEIVGPLGRAAANRLERLGVRNADVRVGDGYMGWPEHAPFDAIMVTAAAPHIPQPLLDQLKLGGRMVIPVGPSGAVQELLVIRKDEMGQIIREHIMSVRFVPLTGTHGKN